MANTLRSRLVLGQDIRQPKSDAKNCPTLSSFVLDQYIPYVKGYKKSWAGDLALYKNHI
jgi:hypothetical protein